MTELTYNRPGSRAMTAASLSNGGNLQRRRFHAALAWSNHWNCGKPRIGHRERPTQISRRQLIATYFDAACRDLLIICAQWGPLLASACAMCMT